MYATMRVTHSILSQLLLSLALFFLLADSATAAPLPQPPIPYPPANTIIVVGNGDTRVQANMAKVNFSVEVVDDTAVAAHRAATETMQRILDALAGQKIADDDIKPHSYNIYVERYYPDYTREDPGTVPLFPDPNEEIRYRVMHQLSVTIRDLQNIPTVIDSVNEAGGNNVYIYGTDFLYNDPDSLEHEAREKAVADAQRKAEEIAQEIGAELGPIIAISEYVQGSGMVWNAPRVPLWPGQLQFTMQIQFTYAIGDASAGTSSIEAAPAITATTAPTATTAVTTSETITIYGGDEESLRQFLIHNYIVPFAPTGDEGSTAIYIGTLPPDLPFTLDLPASMSIIGSVMGTGEFASSQLLLSQEGDITGSVDALRQQFEDQGYTKPAALPSGEIFQTQTGDYSPLCSPDDTHYIVISGRNLPDGSAALRIFIYNLVYGNSPCTQNPASGSGSTNEYEGVMPNLPAPANTGTSQSGMSSTGDSLEATIGLVGETTIAALTEHYYPHLETQGWQQLEASQTEHMAWSSWSIAKEGQRYIATFYIVRDGESPNRFQATFRIKFAR